WLTGRGRSRTVRRETNARPFGGVRENGPRLVVAAPTVPRDSGCTRVTSGSAPEAGSEAIVSKSVTEYDSRTQPPKPTRNRRRWTKITTIVLILVGLLVAADFGLAAFAEHSVSQQARSQFGLDSDPDVTVHGFPFTTQAISGEYDHISVRAEGIEATDALRNVGLRAELHDVSAPLGDLLSGDVSNVTVGELDGRVRLRE